MAKTIVIKQPRPKSDSMGLENYGLSMFPSADSSYALAFIKGQWQHGLDEKDAKIVEDAYGYKFSTDRSSEDFKFWADMRPFKVGHNVHALDMTRAENKLKVGILIAMGELATSIEQAEEPMQDFPFMISNVQEEMTTKATTLEKYHEALVSLTRIKKTKKYIIAVAKYILPRSTNVYDETSAYVKLSEFINNDISTKYATNKSQAIDFFNKVCDMDKAMLYARIDFEDALRKNIIRRDGDMYYYNTFNNNRLGKGIDECVNYLLKPENQDELGAGNKSDKDYSIRFQLNKL